ncbi:hypothetical protein V5O48_005872 [Marasmius crinis-equi]|uniref:Carbonic anhydrase n=1 Tax=Marasmius crinis-equi TaxID=585013 RepID=A0ABR3FL28_9AGAR
MLPTKSTLLFLSTIATTASACVYKRQEQPTRPANWTYTGETGPLLWGFLDPTYGACANGTAQSPIVIDSSVTMTNTTPTMNIPNVDSVTIKNYGLPTMNIDSINGTTTFNGVDYVFRNFHFHTPSEHRLGNEYYPLEMHMVHQADDGSYVVFTMLFELSDSNNTDFVTAAFPVTNSTLDLTPATTGSLDFAPIVKAFQSEFAYTYTGSLTVPPCTEGVQFVILPTPRPIDVQTYLAAKRLLRYNSRPVENTPGSDNLIQVLGNHFRNTTVPNTSGLN